MSSLPSSAVTERQSSVHAWYEQNSTGLHALLDQVEQLLSAQLRDNTPEAKAVVSGRVKTVKSLATKAVKPSSPGGDTFKYDKFHEHIEDIVAVRVIVPMSQELAAVESVIRKKWTFSSEPDLSAHEGDGDQTRPGYRSKHGILDVRRFGGPVAKVEIQVRTILQHAWAELSHDLLYKPRDEQRPDLERRLHAVAGMLELADREFEDIRSASLGLRLTSGPITEQHLQSLATDLFLGEGQSDPTDLAWYSALAENVKSHLRTDEMSDVTNHLGEPLMRDAKKIRSRIATDFAWVNPAYMLDVWIKRASNADSALEYGYDYFMSNPSAVSEDGDG